MKESLELTQVLKASPADVFEAWLTSDGHSEMTGGEAEISKVEGSAYTAWDGYISGKTVSFIENKEIVQTWRTTEFSNSDEDSNLVVRFKEIPDGCELTLIHTNIAEGQTQYIKGWQDFYFTPMQEYFG